MRKYNWKLGLFCTFLLIHPLILCMLRVSPEGGGVDVSSSVFSGSSPSCLPSDPVKPIQSRLHQENLSITLVSPSSGSYVRSTAFVVVAFDPLPQAIQWRWDKDPWNDTTPTLTLNVSVPPVEGTHYIEINTQDTEGEWHSKVWPFIVDDERILITLESPTLGSTHQSGTTITLSYDPTPVRVLFAWDANPLSTLLRPLPEGDGIHTLTVQAEDEVGNFYSETFSFYTDDTPPAFAINAVNDSVLQSWTPIAYSVSADTHVLQFYWDDPSDTFTVIFDPSTNDDDIINQSIEWITTPALSQSHSLTVWMNDSTNNVVTYEYNFLTTLRIGLTYPYAQNPEDSPLQNETVFTTTDTIAIQPATLIECNFSDTPVTAAYNWWLNETTPGANTSSPTPAPTSGTHWLSITANDSLGYWHILKLQVTIDGSVPSITSTTFENHSAVTWGTAMTFSFSEQLYCYAYVWDAGSVGINATIPDPIGEHLLELTLIDFANNTRVYLYQYFTKYLVTPSYPNGTALVGFSVVNATIFPTPTVTWYAWDTLVNVSKPTTLPGDSRYHTLHVYTQDPSGNWYYDRFVYQTILEVELVSPPADWPTQSNTSITLDYSEIPLTTLYSWNNAPWTGFLSPIPTVEGNHSFRVWVENSDLPNTQWFLYEWNVMVDDTPPMIETISLVNNSRINAASVINLTFSEVVDAQYRWVEGQTPLNPWTNVTTLPLGVADGEYTLTITLTDRAGNIAQSTYLYEVDQTPILIYLIQPEGEEVLTYDFDLNVSFSEVPVMVLYNCSWFEGNQTDVPTIPYDNQSIYITVYCTDGLNWNQSTFSFTLIHYLGTLLTISPVNNSILAPNAPIIFTWSTPPKTLKWTWNNVANQTGECQSPSSDGEHQLSLYYQDMSEDWITYQFHFTVDKTAPQLTKEDPVNDSTISEDVTTVNLTFNELVYLAIYRWDVEVNWTTLIAEGDTPQTSLIIPIPKGTHENLTLSLQVEDAIGNLNYFEYVIHRPQPPLSPWESILALGAIISIIGISGVTVYALYNFLPKLIDQFRKESSEK